MSFIGHVTTKGEKLHTSLIKFWFSKEDPRVLEKGVAIQISWSQTDRAHGWRQYEVVDKEANILATKRVGFRADHSSELMEDGVVIPPLDPELRDDILEKTKKREAVTPYHTTIPDSPKG